MLLDPLNAEELRRCAERCAAKARDVGIREERERLLAIEAALLALADNADWLYGRSRDFALQAAAE